MTEINEDRCIVFTPRQITCPKWPVRIAGMQGLWRYVGVVPDSNTFNEVFVEVVGPYFPSNSSRNGGRSRIVAIGILKYAGKLAKPIDVISVETQALSEQAKRATRR